MRHCPNCDGEVIVWDAGLQADKCVDCGESWTLEEQEIDTTALYECLNCGRRYFITDMEKWEQGHRELQHCAPNLVEV